MFLFGGCYICHSLNPKEIALVDYATLSMFHMKDYSIPS